jgi:hypothetical protein
MNPDCPYDSYRIQPTHTQTVDPRFSVRVQLTGLPNGLTAVIHYVWDFDTETIVETSTDGELMRALAVMKNAGRL